MIETIALFWLVSFAEIQMISLIYKTYAMRKGFYFQFEDPIKLVPITWKTFIPWTVLALFGFTPYQSSGDKVFYALLGIGGAPTHTLFYIPIFKELDRWFFIL